MIKNIKIVFLILVIGVGAFAIDPNKPWDVNIVSFKDFGTSNQPVTGWGDKETYMVQGNSNVGTTSSNLVKKQPTTWAWNDISNYYKNYSQTVANLTDTLSVSSGGALSLNLNSGINVISMDKSQWKRLWGINITGGDDTSRLFINIDNSGTVDLGGLTWNLGNDVDTSQILVNIANADILKSGYGKQVSILAPNATFQNGGGITLYGNLICKDMGGGSYNVHKSTFKGDGIVTVVPEPSSFILSIFAFVSLMLKRRRK